MNTEHTEHYYHDTDYGVMTRLTGSDQRGNVEFSTLPRERLISDIEKRVITVEKILQRVTADLLIESGCEL